MNKPIKNVSGTDVTTVNLPKINLQRTIIRVVGDASLIMHAWSEKAKLLMLNKQMKKANVGKEAKDPVQDFIDSMYWLTEKPTNGVIPDDARFYFPSVAFKAAAVSAARYIDGVKMTELRGAFHIIGDRTEIHSSQKPAMREDMVRVGMGTADIRFRGEFTDWYADLSIRYNANAIALEQVVNLFEVAGFGVGVGEWRPEKDGSFGMFHVETGA